MIEKNGNRKIKNRLAKQTDSWMLQEKKLCSANEKITGSFRAGGLVKMKNCELCGEKTAGRYLHGFEICSTCALIDDASLKDIIAEKQKKKLYDMISYS